MSAGLYECQVREFLQGAEKDRILGFIKNDLPHTHASQIRKVFAVRMDSMEAFKKSYLEGRTKFIEDVISSGIRVDRLSLSAQSEADVDPDLWIEMIAGPHVIDFQI